MTAESRLPVAKGRPVYSANTALMVAALGAFPIGVPQLSLLATTTPAVFVTEMNGSTRNPVIPTVPSAGPSARMRSVRVPAPALTERPGIMIVDPVPTTPRVDRLASLAVDAVGETS